MTVTPWVVRVGSRDDTMKDNDVNKKSNKQFICKSVKVCAHVVNLSTQHICTENEKQVKKE